MNYRQNQKKDFNQHESTKGYVDTISKILDIKSASSVDTKEAIDKIQDIMRNVVVKDRFNRVKTHQIRNIFSLIKNVKNVKELNMIRPKLAYIGARQTGNSGKFIVEVIEGLIDVISGENNTVKQENELFGLKYIMESIVAYHKFYFKD